jgi:hypothetical protein
MREIVLVASLIAAGCGVKNYSDCDAAIDRGIQRVALHAQRQGSLQIGWQ